MVSIKKYGISFICLCLTLVLLTGCSSKAVVNLGNYTGLEVEVSKAVVTNKDVDNAIIEEIISKQENVNIKNRAVRNGDIVNIDFLGKVDGKAFEGGTDTDYDLEIGSGKFIPGFEEQVVGMKIGKKADIKVTFPDPYSSNTALSGKEAVFTVKVNSISGKKLPAKITNAMIKEISDTYETVSEYRKHVKAELETQAEETTKQRTQAAIWNEVVKLSKVEKYLSSKVRYYSGLYEANYQSYADYYGVDLSEFIKTYMGITVEDFNSYKKSYGEETAKNCAIADAIAEAQNITLTDEEYDKYLVDNNVSADDKKQFGESIKDDMLYQKVADFIISKSTIKYI